MRLVIAQAAYDDLEHIKHYYLEQQLPEVGLKFVAEILNAIEKTLEYPDIGRIVPEFNQANIRELIRPPHRIVYLREAEQITLIRVWRSERLLDL
jgi:plasmid stabilization system protein ParE